MTEFLTRFRQQALNDTLSLGDTVMVIGTDEFKGFRGTVTGSKSVGGENIYAVELQANSKRIDRAKSSLIKCYD